MFYIIMKITPIHLYNTHKLSFRSNYSSTKSDLSSIGSLNHETYLFREPKTDEFVQDYIRKKLAQNSNITLVSGACSSGDEIMSYMVMLDDVLDKVRFCAFDIDENLVNQAKEGKVYLTCNSMEGSLLGKLTVSKYKQKCAKKFHKHFMPTGLSLPPTLDSNLQLLSLLNPILYQREINKLAMREYSFDSEMTKKIDFQCGDIRILDFLYDNESVDILLFRNAMYHILCKYNEDDDRIELDDSKQIADLIAHKMFEILKKDGLVVFGEKENQQGIKISTIHNAMIKNGFKPVYTEPNELEKTLYLYVQGYADLNRHCHIYKKP